MEKLTGKIGVIGAGNMGEAFIGALIRSKTIEPLNLIVSDINEQSLEYLNKEYGIETLTDNAALFFKSDIVILSVKPQVMDQVLIAIVENKDYPVMENRKLIISIAAGITVQRLENTLYTPLDKNSTQKLPIIRAMPNTPALVLSGVAGMSGNIHTTSRDLEIAEKILAAMGIVVKVEEEAMDGVTALSGSGPAYVFYLAEAMIDAGIHLGFDPQTAKTLSINTIKGALKLMEAKDESPELLRRKVTSPGGTTEAAINVLETNTVKQIIIEAITAAAERSKELSK